MIERDGKVMFGAHTRTPELPLAVDRAEGMRIWDLDQREYLDFGAGYAVCATGHCHPGVTKAIAEQTGRLLHISGSDFYYSSQLELAEHLVQITPGDFEKRVYFANSGAESLEAAFKLTRHYTRRSVVLAYLGSFHGRTFVGMSLSGSKQVQRSGFFPLIPEVVHLPYPYCYRCPFNLSYPDCRSGEFEGIPMLPCVRYMTDVIFRQLIGPEDVAALFVEPIQGEGGYIVPPPEFHPLLRAITARYGILYVLDEIQSGLGRTGRMFACEHWGVEPDVICLAKAIASGLPLGATVARAELMDSSIDPRAWRPGSHGSTFGGNPVACAAGIATLKLIEGGLVENAARIGEYLLNSLSEMRERHRIIGDVRGKGLMIGIELVKDKLTKEPFPEAVTADQKNIKEVFMGSCFKRGLLILGCGFNSIRLSPPLIISKGDADEGIRIIESVITEIEGQMS
jgi:4-aminobutyrate aminotransferase